MPTFHFNARTGDVIVPDIDGEELPDVDAARKTAVRDARESIVEAMKVSDTPPDHIQVTDSEGREVLVVALADMLKTQNPRK